MSQWKESFLQFIKFSLVGLSNTLISYATYYILVVFGIHYIIANTIGYGVGIINSFILNRKLVFKTKIAVTVKKAFIRMVTCYVGTYILSLTLLYVLVEGNHMSKLFAPVLILFITVPINFILNKVWAFKIKKEKQRDEKS